MMLSSGWDLGCWARAEETFETKMAERGTGDGQEGCAEVDIVDIQSEDNSVKKSSKRCSSTSPASAPCRKSPRHDSLSPNSEIADAETHQPAGQMDNTVFSPTAAQRKSWRRATLTRRSLPAVPNPYQSLSRNISTSLPLEERLEKLMEASMKLALERTERSLPSVASVSLESFHKQVEAIQKEWICLSQSLRREPHRLPSNAFNSSDPAVLKAMENIQNAINRLQSESESWESLLDKHRNKAEELERKVQQGQESGIALNSRSLAQSSQFHFIQNKPDYHHILHRQQPMIHTMEMIMDTQCKMVQKLQSIKEHSQLLVKKTSNQLVTEAGFQNLSSDLLRNLMRAPLPTTTS